MSINYDEFKKFIKDNNVVGVAAGMIIALATKDLIYTIKIDTLFEIQI